MLTTIKTTFISVQREICRKMSLIICPLKQVYIIDKLLVTCFVHPATQNPHHNTTYTLLTLWFFEEV